MRVPRKIKKAAKHVERHMRHTSSGLLVIPCDKFVVKGRCTKRKQKLVNEAKREYLKMLLEEWQRYDGAILMH
jgi:hypothetical protein